jgi:hypothetical protein
MFSSQGTSKMADAIVSLRYSIRERRSFRYSCRRAIFAGWHGQGAPQLIQRHAGRA